MKNPPRPGGTCGESRAEQSRAEQPPARRDAVPAAGSTRSGAGVRGVRVRCGGVCVCVCARCVPAAALTGAPRARVRGAAARLCRRCAPARGAEAARLRPRRSLRLGHRPPPPLRSSGLAARISIPIFRPSLYNKSFLFTKTVVIRPRVNRM